MRTSIGAAIILCTTAGSALANTSHHSSSGSGSSTAECIRWEPIPVDMAGRDMATPDMTITAGDGGAPGSDLGDAADLGSIPPDLGGSHIGMRCVERASLFDCSYAPARGGAPGGGALGKFAVVGLFAALMLARARARRHG